MFGNSKKDSTLPESGDSVRAPRSDEQKENKMTKRNTGSTASIYNVSGAAAVLGRASSTIVAAIDRGELVADVDYRTAAGKTKRMISADALRAYRDVLVVRFATFKTDEARSEVARLRSLNI